METQPIIQALFEVVTEEMTFNDVEKNIVVYVKWKIPRGYKDSDIYGYESPAVYPIQCHSPEDELPTPSIVIFQL